MENIIRFSTFHNNDNDYNNDETKLVLNMDELYERKRIHYEMKLNTFRKILKRIFKRIKLSSRKYPDHQYIYYEIPQFIIGTPRYHMEELIEYLVHKLKENGFLVKYIHPHILFITWAHYIPYHERLQYKMKTGITIDEFGNKIERAPRKQEDIKQKKILYDKKEKKYKQIDDLKPIGLYSKELIQQMKQKVMN